MTLYLRTRRLTVRPWRDGDRPALERMATDAEMMRHITDGRPWSATRINELLERQARHLREYGVCFGAVTRSGSDEVIGLAGMQPIDSGEFELGWWIWRDHWGRGYAVEAARPFIARARDVLELDRLIAVIDPANAASIRVAEKLGMRYERTCSARETITTREDKPVCIYAARL